MSIQPSQNLKSKDEPDKILVKFYEGYVIINATGSVHFKQMGSVLQTDPVAFLIGYAYKENDFTTSIIYCY